MQRVSYVFRTRGIRLRKCTAFQGGLSARLEKCHLKGDEIRIYSNFDAIYLNGRGTCLS